VYLKKYMKKYNNMASVRKMAEEIEPRPAVVATSRFGYGTIRSVSGGVVAPNAINHVVAPLDVVATLMVRNVNEEPHFDIDDDLSAHMRDEENLPDDNASWFNDEDGDNVAADLANRNEEEACSLTFKETYVGNVHPIIRKVESLITRYIWSGREVVTCPSSSNVKIDAHLLVLRTISHMIENNLKIDTSNISRKHPEI
jgi:hypothetical protein